MPMHREGFSDFLHRRRVALGKKWKAVLSEAYLSRATLHRIRNGDPHHPIAEIDSMRALAHALKFSSWADMLEAFDRNDVEVGLDDAELAPANGAVATAVAETEPPASSSEDAVLALSRALNLTPTELVRRLRPTDPSPTVPSLPKFNGPASQPSSLQTLFKRPAKMVAHFSSGVAASKLVEKVEEEDPEQRLPVDTEDVRVFTVPVDGDCQEPVWKDGEVVLFSFDAYEREGIIPGKSYYLALIDGTSTFKRVFLDASDPEMYILRCWNHRRYPTQRRVRFDEVVRIARAISKQTNPELADDDATREAALRE
jgi:hypothetical protein